MTKNALQAVIFDLDDTLYPEIAFVQSGFRAVAQWVATRWPYDPDQVTANFMRLHQDGVRGNTFAVWLASEGQIAPGLEADMVRVFRTHAPRIAPFSDAPKVLESLRQRFVLGLVSDGILAVQRNKLESLRLAPFFSEIVFSDALGREFWKPSPRPFETILGRLNVSPSQAIYVADNVSKDFLAPRQLGMGTIQIKRVGSVYADLQPATANHAAHCIVNNLEQLCDLMPDFAW